jgi:hypothetical protein
MCLNSAPGAFRNKFLYSSVMTALLGLTAPLFASGATSGQLIIVNGLANVVNGYPGNTASAVKIVVNDATGPCYTNTSVAYKGIITVTWAASNTHSVSSCTDITSVDISALKTAFGVVQYDSTVNSTPPAAATAPTTFTAPSTPITNLALIVTGTTSPASTHSASSWGSALGVVPVCDPSNGMLTTTGIPGSVGTAGIKAEKIMAHYGITPLT